MNDTENEAREVVRNILDAAAIAFGKDDALSILTQVDLDALQEIVQRFARRWHGYYAHEIYMRGVMAGGYKAVQSTRKSA